MKNVEFLKSHPLFGAISDDNLLKIIPLLEQEIYDSGDFIIHENDYGDRLFFIAKGQVEVIKIIHSATDNNKHPTRAPNTSKCYKRLATLSRGDTFGEMELIDIQKRSASVRALNRVVALTLSHENIHNLYKRDPESFTLIIMNIAREISRRLRAMDEVVTIDTMHYRTSSKLHFTSNKPN